MQTPSELLLELAKLLGIDQGERRISVVFSDGAIRRVHVELGPLRPVELDELAVRQRP